MELPRIEAEVNGYRLDVEIASSPEARHCGLSMRDSLKANGGMLFIVPEPILFGFWMKDTKMPLSIAFLDDNGRILSIEQMPPMQTKVIYRSKQLVRYAIEVNQGWFAQHNIHVGESLKFLLPEGLGIQ
jgi:uncharacterized membrane protein (UPF0127 family)